MEDKGGNGFECGAIESSRLSLMEEEDWRAVRDGTSQKLNRRRKRKKNGGALWREPVRR